MNEAPDARVTWIGHATVVIEMGGVRIVTDPIIRPFLGALFRRGPRYRPELTQGVDAVLCSHSHHDHFDPPSLRRFGRDALIITARGLGPLVAREGFHRVFEMEAGDATKIGDVTVTAVRADHQGGRAPFGPSTAAIGFVVSGPISVYFAGDTDVFAEMAEMAGAVQVALLPVWGWGPRLGDGHMDPEGAARAVALIRPQVAVPIHWGTLSLLGVHMLRPGFLYDPPHLFAVRARQELPGVDVRVLPPGGTLELFARDDVLEVVRA